jgi:hypothetical protein
LLNFKSSQNNNGKAFELDSMKVKFVLSKPKSMLIGKTSPFLANKLLPSPTRSLKALKSRKRWILWIGKEFLLNKQNLKKNRYLLTCLKK